MDVSQEVTDDELERAALLSSWRRRRPDDPVSTLLRCISEAVGLQQGCIFKRRVCVNIGTSLQRAGAVAVLI